MEESEKRRARLRAMRMKAEEAEVCINAENLGPSSLYNPLRGNYVTQPMKESYMTPRFDFYTDPMSAFSANKKRGQPDYQITQDYFTHPVDSTSAMARPSSSFPEPGYPEITPSPSHQLQNSSSSDRRMYQAQGPYNSTAAYGNPRGIVNPLPTHQGTPEAWNGSRATSNNYNSAPHSHRNPGGMVSSFPVMHQGTPEAWNGSGGTASYYSPSNVSGGGHLFSPLFGPIRSPGLNYGQGRPHSRGNSPSPGSGRGGHPGSSSGRGKGCWYGANASPGSGHSGGRGQGFHSRGCEPECFYHKSMDENPWEQLQPIIWKSRSLQITNSSSSWLPKSISMKKPKVSEASNWSSTQPSLAEYLAASFNETVHDSPSS